MQAQAWMERSGHRLAPTTFTRIPPLISSLARYAGLLAMARIFRSRPSTWWKLLCS